MFLSALRSTRASKAATFCVASRLYHCKKNGVYGFNAPLHERRKQSMLDSQDLKLSYEARNENPNLYRYVEAYRRHGHTVARTNPVTSSSMPKPTDVPKLNPARYGLEDTETFCTEGLLYGVEAPSLNLEGVSRHLERLYCRHLGLDVLAVEDEAEVEWLCERYETIQSECLTSQERREVAIKMLESQNLDRFLATKFSNVKRYGAEGAEGMMAFFVELLYNAGRHGLTDIILGMPHRGRLNLLTGLLEFPPVVMFRKMRGLSEFPPEQHGSGDVLSHLSTSVDLPGKGAGGGALHVILLPNPSHLEAVNPVAMGKARGSHMSRSNGDYSTDPNANDSLVGDEILSVLVHGDASIAGQGVNQETLAMSCLPHYTVGGSLHLVVDNQLGFTTPGDRGRSTRYAADVAKLSGSPVIHVNGDVPEDIVRATRLALEHRSRYHKDVFVEIHCVRRWGHNELDDPSFTNPTLYQTIEARKSVPDVYGSEVLGESVADDVVRSHSEELARNHEAIEGFHPHRVTLKGLWSGMSQPSDGNLSQWETGLSVELLKFIGAKSVSHPESMSVHPHLQKTHLRSRLGKLNSGEGLEWGTCEALAIGSLLYQGFNVRLSGQDVGRATFSHRHAMLVDQTDNEIVIPLNAMDCEGRIEVANSLLSEEAVLGFEYGFSIDSPRNLVIWEAQFGDFFNGAQIILDTFVSNGESKWGLQSALTLLLPHGMDGAGPEHSSCRLERFLQMSDSREATVDADDVNWNVVTPTTGAQYFHLLRRQMVRNFRKPLVVVAPKTMLRLAAASSKLSDMGPGTYFRPVLCGEISDKGAVRRLVFTSGKHYHALAKYAKENGIRDTAFVRLEQLCPFPTRELQNEVNKYPNAKSFVWSQEEHRNAGAWTFVQPRFRNMIGLSNLVYVGRKELCQPAVGVAAVHRDEEAKVLHDTFVA